MRKILFVCAAILVSSPLVAQQQAPAPPPVVPYIPITITEQDHNQLRDWLMEQPTKFSLPVLQWLEEQQRKARVAKAKDAAPVAEAPKPIK